MRPRLNVLVDDRVRDELKSGVQTIQYQINTLMTTNGQSPFVTLFLNLREDDPYLEENARIVEEVLRQRLEGIKNEAGVYITPAFPKLIYVLDEHNCPQGRPVLLHHPSSPPPARRSACTPTTSPPRR